MIEAKKSFGQHFLKDENIARKIVERFNEENPVNTVLEIGPGTGMLTKYLLENAAINLYAVEADIRMIPFLKDNFPRLSHQLIHDDFLDLDLNVLPAKEFSIIGNFPYNISSRILFKVYENKERVAFLTGMFQREVAQRIAAKHGNKAYGILSVFMQAYYDVQYLFEVHEKCFNPPPKVKSAIIQLLRKKTFPGITSEKIFTQSVKAGFNQRRKTLRNSLKHLVSDQELLSDETFNQRAEQLSVEEWTNLANKIASARP